MITHWRSQLFQEWSSESGLHSILCISGYQFDTILIETSVSIHHDTFGIQMIF